MDITSALRGPSESISDLSEPVAALTAREYPARASSGVVWLTGLSGAGKSTLSELVSAQLHELGYRTFTVDGDTLRAGLNSDLGFSAADRKESVRRAAHTAALLADAGFLVFVALIAPFASDRARAREIIGAQYHEVFVNAGIDACRQRDPKGLYRRAFRGEIPNFTGVTSPYEPPVTPDLMLDSRTLPASECALLLINYIRARFAPLSAI